MLREVKEDLNEGIYIRFRTDSSTFYLHRLLARAKSDLRSSCPWTAVFRWLRPPCSHRRGPSGYCQPFLPSSQSFRPYNHLEEDRSTPPTKPRSPYISSNIYIDGHPLNVIQRFTYLGSIITNDTTPAKDAENRMSKASSAFSRLQKRVWQTSLFTSPPKLWYKRLLSSIPSCRTSRHGCRTEGKSNVQNSFTNAAFAPSWTLDGRITELTMKSWQKSIFPVWRDLPTTDLRIWINCHHHHHCYL